MTLTGSKLGPREWRTLSTAFRDQIGSSDALQVEDTCWVEQERALYVCTSVDGANASSWLPVGAGASLIYTADFVDYGVENGTTDLNALGDGSTVSVNGVTWTIGAQGTYTTFEINDSEGMSATELSNTRMQDGLPSVITAAHLWVHLEDIPMIDPAMCQTFIAQVDVSGAGADTEICGIALYCPTGDAGPADEAPAESVTTDNSRIFIADAGQIAGENPAFRMREEPDTTTTRSRYGAGVTGRNAVAITRKSGGIIDAFACTSVGGALPLTSSFVWLGSWRQLSIIENETFGDFGYIRLAVFVSEENLSAGFTGSVQRCWVLQS